MPLPVYFSLGYLTPPSARTPPVPHARGTPCLCLSPFSLSVSIHIQQTLHRMKRSLRRNSPRWPGPARYESTGKGKGKCAGRNAYFDPSSPSHLALCPHTHSPSRQRRRLSPSCGPRRPRRRRPRPRPPPPCRARRCPRRRRPRPRRPPPHLCEASWCVGGSGWVAPHSPRGGRRGIRLAGGRKR